MITDRDLNRIVRSWLKENTHEDAGRVLDSALYEVDTTPQRQPSWLERGFPLMSNAVRFALAAAAAAVLALIGYQLLIAPNVGGPGPAASQAASPSISAAPSPAPSAAAQAFPPPGPLAIGRHSMTLAGVPLSIEVRTAGWTSNGDFDIHRGDPPTPDAAGFVFWRASAADNVFGDPCAHTPLSPPAGSSAAELAAAVSAVPGTDLVSGPSEVTVGGYPTQHVVLTVREDVGCAPNEFYLWYDDDVLGEADGRYATELGSTIYVWIIDVDGTHVWIDGETYATSGPQAEQDVRQMVDSIRFE